MTRDNQLAHRAPMGTVAVGVDGSECALDAVAWAAREAVARAACLVLVHAVVEPRGILGATARDVRWLDSRGRFFLDEAALVARDAAPGSIVNTRLVTGSPATVLASASDAADLLVVGTSDGGLLESALFGSTATELERRISVPLVVAGGADPGTLPETGSLPIVVGVGASGRQGKAVRFAVDEARIVGAPLVLAHVGGDTGSAATSWRLFEDVRRANPDLLISYRPLPGRVVEGLVTCSYQARMIVVGAGRRVRLHDLAVGSVGRGLLESDVSPLVIVPQGPRRQLIEDRHPLRALMSFPDLRVPVTEESLVGL